MSGGQNGVPAAMGDEIKDLLVKESALSKELGEVLSKIKVVREARDKVLNDPKSKVCRQQTLLSD